MTTTRVSCTPAAAALIHKLKRLHGAGLMFHQSGGCCDGSAPMCYPLGEFKLGDADVYLGEVEGCPVYMGKEQFEYWRHTSLIIDAVPGRGGGFSLEAPEGMRFLTRSRLLNEVDEVPTEQQPGSEPEGLPPLLIPSSR